MEKNWKIEPQFMRELFNGNPPLAHSLKCRVVDIQGNHVKLAFAFCDANDQALCTLDTEYIMYSSVLTLAGLERAFTVTVSEL